MNAIEELEQTIGLNYKDEDGESYKAILLPGLSDEELADFERKMPNGKLPEDIKKLLLRARGFNFYGLEDIWFTGLPGDDVKERFPNLFHQGITLAGDGSGNYWFQHIDHEGNWNGVYYINHEMCVVVKHSDNPAQFIAHVRDLGLRLDKSHLDMIHEKRVYEIDGSDDWKIPHEEALGIKDATLANFAARFTGEYYFCDMRNSPLLAGFSFYKSEQMTPHPDELIWAIKPGKSFFQKMIAMFKRGQ